MDVKSIIYSLEGILWSDTAKPTTKRMLEQKKKRMHRLKYDEEGNDLTKPRNQKNLSREDLERLEYLGISKEPGVDPLAYSAISSFGRTPSL